MPTRLRRRDDLDRGIEEAGAADADVALVAHAVDQVVHAVEAAQQGGLAAAGGADEGGDLAARDLHVDVERAPASGRRRG
jgi:hypothetical protein